MVFDTDVLIFALRGHAGAGQILDAADRRAISLVTYLELLAGIRGRKEHARIRSFLKDLAIETIPLSEQIGQRAAIYMEEHGAGSGMGQADALIAGTAVERSLPLCTANTKHFSGLKDLALRSFKP